MYEQIKQLLQSGRIVIFTESNWKERLVILFYEWKFLIKNCWRYTKEETERYSKQESRKITKIITPERHIYKAGDIVDLDIEALEKCDDWKEHKDSCWDWKWLEIKQAINDIAWLYYRIYTKDKSGYISIWHEYILPHTPSDQSKEERLAEWVKQGWAVDGKIIK